MPAINPSLWFNNQAEEAAKFYCSIFPNSEITKVNYYSEGSNGEPGNVLTVDFVLDGCRFGAVNGGPMFAFSEAISFVVPCADAAEVDYYWDALTAGGSESQCGWLKDRYGLSWQIVPDGLGEVLGDPDPERAKRAVQAMMGMRKLDLAAMRVAANGG